MNSSILAACLAFTNYMEQSQNEVKFLRQGDRFYGEIAEIQEITPLKFCQKSIEVIDLDNGQLKKYRLLSRKNPNGCDASSDQRISIWNCPNSFEADKVVSLLEKKFTFNVRSMKCSLLESTISVIGTDDVAREVKINFSDYKIKSVMKVKFLGDRLLVRQLSLVPLKSPCMPPEGIGHLKGAD